MTITIQTLILGDLATNCYLLTETETKQTLIVDPADDANYISEEILRQNLTPLAIIATHGHFDHLLAAWELEMAFSIPTLISSDDVFLLKTMTSSATHWLGRKVIEKPPQNVIPINNPSSVFDLCLPAIGCCRRQLQAGTLHFASRVIPTPGHTPGSICLYLPKEKLLFTGDTLFAEDEVGRTDLSYSSPKQLTESISLLKTLPPDTTIYPGHGSACQLTDHNSHPA